MFLFLAVFRECYLVGEACIRSHRVEASQFGFGFMIEDTLPGRGEGGGSHTREVSGHLGERVVRSEVKCTN